MVKHVDGKRVLQAVGRLLNIVNPLFADLLILKRHGARPDQAVPMTTSATAEDCEVVLGVRSSDGSPAVPLKPYFNPFRHRARWLTGGYPRSGTYTNLDGPTLARLVDFPEGQSPRRLTFKAGYVQLTAEEMRTRSNTPLKVPIGEVAIWCTRSESFADTATMHDVVDRFVTEFRITIEERATWFVEDAAADAGFVPGPPIPGEIAGLLTSAYPPEPGKGGLTGDPPGVVPALATSLYERVVGGMVVPELTVKQLVALVRLGRNVILTGPPGTGKTTLALNLANAAAEGQASDRLPTCAGMLPTTATSDWTTFDTIGGYVSGKDGELVFREGLFLKAIREDKWLIVDELNRCDADKAFGQLFTVLSGQRVELPFRTTGAGAPGGPVGETSSTARNLAIRKDPHVVASRFDEREATYVIGADWRIIGTMNSFDRSHLYQLSAAFVRRFAAVNVPVPTVAELADWFEGLDLQPWAKPRLIGLAKLLEEERPVGPAILGDVVAYLVHRLEEMPGSAIEMSGEAAPAAPDEDEGAESEDKVEDVMPTLLEDPFLEAVVAYIIPQMDGLDLPAYGKLKAGLNAFVRPSSRRELNRHFKQTLRV